MTYRELYNSKVIKINKLREALKKDPGDISLRKQIEEAEENLIATELKTMTFETDEYFRSYNPDFDND